MNLFQNSEIRVFESAIPQKSSSVEIMPLIHSLGPPKSISSNIGPILQRCKNFEKLGIIFDMKLIETVKYVFSNQDSHKSLPLWKFCLGYTL